MAKLSKVLFSVIVAVAGVITSQSIGWAEGKPQAAALEIQVAVKTSSVFCPVNFIKRAKANAKKYTWAVDMRREIIDAAKPWKMMSDDKLWSLMFGSTITRSWDVWSTGYCPTCKVPVSENGWVPNGFKEPWKLRCPHCRDSFPKNDFRKFYLSGMDEHGVFDPKHADRSLLFNTQHPDPKDPLHMFGVDDGEGYLDGQGNCWRFIGYYLLNGHWKPQLFDGIRKLAAAYVVTGDMVYAHKSGVLLDRVADLYPTFDYEKQGLAYGNRHGSGYVSTWHDACVETLSMAIAYDRVFDALRKDKALVSFLSEKSRKYGIGNSKSSFKEIQSNIETRIFRDAIANPQKIACNYPNTDVAIVMIKAILGWPGNKGEVMPQIDDIIQKTTAVDGVTGEKGLPCYSAFVLQPYLQMLAAFQQIDPNFLVGLLKRHPRLLDTCHFFIDLWCQNQKYYPNIGDAADIAQKEACYIPLLFQKPGCMRGKMLFETDAIWLREQWMAPSMYAFLWELYKLSGDKAFARLIYLENDNRLAGLPYDLFSADPRTVVNGISSVVGHLGRQVSSKSVNKENWHLALLRAGMDSSKTEAWLSYDSGGKHGHMNAMNLGLYAKGLDLMPDFGYYPHKYRMAGTPPELVARMSWYQSTAGHNTVVVDGKDSPNGNGKTSLWADGDQFHAVRVSGLNMSPVEDEHKQLERTEALVGISDRDAYLVDIFRVVGGKEHAKYMRSTFSTADAQGLSLHPANTYGSLPETVMRNWREDASPKMGWSFTWNVEDRYGYISPKSKVFLRYTDLTTDAHVRTSDGWAFARFDGLRALTNGGEDIWIPTLVVSRQSQDANLQSTFVGVIEPFEGKSNIAHIQRLRLQTTDGQAYSDANIAVEVLLADGERDIILSADTENPLAISPSLASNGALVQPDWGLSTDAEMCMIRLGQTGKVERIALANGSWLTLRDVNIRLHKKTDNIEIRFDKGHAVVVSGNQSDLEVIKCPQ